MRFGRSGRARTAIVFGVIGALFTLVPGEALAKKKAGFGAKKAAGGGASVVSACVDDYKSALKLEETGQLIPARERFVRCSKAACGSPLREECTTRFTQLDTEIPSVIPIATDAEGAPRFDVEVKMDGQLLTDKLDGHAWPLNPGRHELTFSADGQVFSTQELLVIQGQRNRPVQATLGGEAKSTQAPTRAPARTRKPAAVAVTPASDTEAAPPSAPKKVKELPRPEVAAKQITDKEQEEKESSAPEVTLATESADEGSSKLPYVLGAAGLASLGAGAAFIYWGRKDNSRLSECSIPDAANCPQSSVDHIHRMYLIGNVALGVGVAALGAAYWLHTRSGSSTKEQQSEEAYRLDVVPTQAGAVASVSGSF